MQYVYVKSEWGIYVCFVSWDAVINCHSSGIYIDMLMKSQLKVTGLEGHSLLHLIQFPMVLCSCNQDQFSTNRKNIYQYQMNPKRGILLKKHCCKHVNDLLWNFVLYQIWHIYLNTSTNQRELLWLSGILDRCCGKIDLCRVQNRVAHVVTRSNAVRYIDQRDSLQTRSLA